MNPHSFFALGNTVLGFVFLVLAVTVDVGLTGLNNVSDKVLVWTFIIMSVITFMVALYNTMKIPDKEEQIGKIK